MIRWEVAADVSNWHRDSIVAHATVASVFHDFGEDCVVRNSSPNGRIIAYSVEDLSDTAKALILDAVQSAFSGHYPVTLEAGDTELRFDTT